MNRLQNPDMIEGVLSTITKVKRGKLLLKVLFYTDSAFQNEVLSVGKKKMDSMTFLAPRRGLMKPAASLNSLQHYST